MKFSLLHMFWMPLGNSFNNWEWALLSIIHCYLLLSQVFYYQSIHSKPLLHPTGKPLLFAPAEPRRLAEPRKKTRHGYRFCLWKPQVPGGEVRIAGAHGAFQQKNRPQTADGFDG